MPRHHVVPQMYLRRFADDKDQIVMTSRQRPEERHRSSVARACREVGYYAIPAEDLEESARAGHDPEAVERVRSEIEGTANLRLRELLEGGCAPTGEVRFRLSLFFALQMTRGAAFRRSMNEFVTALAPSWLDTEFSEENIRRRLIQQGKEVSNTFVNEVRALVTGPNAPQPQWRQGHFVQQAPRTRFAAPGSLLSRTWRVLDFDTPCLITSDEPVAALAGEGLLNMGPANTPAIWVPLEGQHALAMTLSGSEGVVHSGEVRARRINQMVSDQAERWIIFHPDDQEWIPATLGPRMEWRDEIVGSYTDGDEVHEQHILVPRPEAD